MTPNEKLYLFFAILGFVIGLLPGFIMGCAFMQRKFFRET